VARPDPFAAVAAEEEFVAAACAAVSQWVPDAAAELHRLAAAHLQAAIALSARPRRPLRLLATLRATLSAAVGTELGALGWLRKQEQRLVDRYVVTADSAALDAGERTLLMRERIPAQFERFACVDQLLLLRE
jgi:hypothetical protein